MLCTRKLLLSVFVITLLPFAQRSAVAAEMRAWTDASGSFQVEAKVLTADQNLVVLERRDGELLALRRGQLSDPDRQFLQKHDAAAKSAPELDVDSSWKLANGETIAGKLSGFGRQELTVKRERGDVWINERRLEELPSAYRKILPQVVAFVDNKPIESLNDLESHLIDAGGGPLKYTVEGIQLVLKEWGAVTVPISLLDKADAKAVAAGYERWKSAQDQNVSDQERAETESRERLSLDSRQRLQRRGDADVRRQMKVLELGLLAAEAGITDVWEVMLHPRNRYGYPRSVAIVAPDSLTATQRVTAKYPGWRVGGVAKLTY